MPNLQTGGSPSNSITNHWPFYAVGILLVLLGPIIYFLLFRMHHLSTPWYAPILATIGVFLMALSVWHYGGWARAIGLILVVLLCGFEWFILLVGSRTPQYAGPAVSGQQLPEFVTTLADGSSISNQDLKNGKPSVMLFFRGRW